MHVHAAQFGAAMQRRHRLAGIEQPGRIEGVAGVNLPMLLRVITYRERSMDVLVKKAVAGACEGVVHMK